MGGFGGGGGSGGGRTDAGANRSTASRVGVGNINEKGQKTSSRSGGNGFTSAVKKVAKFVATGGITGAVIRGVTKSIKKNKLDKSLIGTPDYQGSTSRNNVFTAEGNGNDDQPQGIEFAKASTTSATILGPAEIQKEAANNVKGPTTTEMTAGQISLANKRKGRRSTNITAKKTLANNYTLSTKTLLG